MNTENKQLEQELDLMADRLDTLAESGVSDTQREILQGASQALHEVCGMLCAQPLLRKVV